VIKRKQSNEYCTKFGTAMHSAMDVEVRARLSNFGSVTANHNVDALQVQVGVIADQDYERLQNSKRPSCYDY